MKTCFAQCVVLFQTINKQSCTIINKRYVCVGFILHSFYGTIYYDSIYITISNLAGKGFSNQFVSWRLVVPQFVELWPRDEG